MSDVFVSYKAEDRRRVEPLVEALEADGLSVWWDAEIGGGARWRETILKNLEAAACVIVIWSRRSSGSDGEFVHDEASRAKRRNTYLPVRIDKVEPPLGFGESQALVLQGWRGNREDKRYQAVLRAVRSQLGAPVRSAPRHRGPDITRRTALAGGAVAIAAAAGASAWWFSTPAPAATSIAVLPFENLSGDPGQRYFSDGIAEELRAVLSRISGLKVVARISSESVRDDNAKIAARKLDVGNILTGSVRRSSSIIRISAQLIEGRTGMQRWSQDYDRGPGDALQIESDISQQVAAALELQLIPALAASVVAGGTKNASAHDYFLKAQSVIESGHTAENLNSAIHLFDAALELDPAYADAYAGKAGALFALSSGFSHSQAEMELLLSQADRLAQRAIELAPQSASAHAARSGVALARLDFKGALSETRKAVSAPGVRPAILAGYGHLLAELGLTGDAYAIAKRVISLDPLNPKSYTIDAEALYSDRLFGRAIAAEQRVLTLRPTAGPPWIVIADSLLNLGKYQEARAAYAHLAVDDAYRLTGEGIIAHRLGNATAAAGAAKRIAQSFGGAASYQLAQLQAQRGDHEAAFASLNLALRVRDTGLISLLVDPYLDPIRGDRLFSAFRSEINFPPGIGR